MKKLFFFLVFFCLLGEAQSSDKNLLNKPEEGKGMVYILRPSFFPHFGFEIYLDSKEKSAEIGAIRGRHYINFNVNPGKHTIYANAMNWAEITFEIKENETIFILQDVTGIGPLSTTELTAMSKEEAVKKLRSLSIGFINRERIQAINSVESANTVVRNSEPKQDSNQKYASSESALLSEQKTDTLSDHSFKKESSKQKSKSENGAGQKTEEERRNREQANKNQRINLQVTNTQPDVSGIFTINIQTNADTASLQIDGIEEGGKKDGIYTIKRVARAGQDSSYKIVAIDVFGNEDVKTISVARQIAQSGQIKYPELNPALVKSRPDKDAVAIIIGIADYKNLPKADYANDDARVFYDYAIRGLGVKPENIKLLIDTDAGQSEILKAFKTWLPARVKPTTDIYVYYSGHGLPSSDGQTLYLLPQQVDRDLIEDTSVAQSRINAAIQATKPKSVTIFLDSCYSGAARTGQTLVASARPISLKANAQTFPSEFTVLAASTAEQISSSSPELKHGIFSYYLMKGMEGDADANKDGKITTGEMHGYLMDNVVRQASFANRVQQPQLTGDPNKVLVGR